MEYYALALLWALVAYVIYRYVAAFLEERRIAAEAKRRGCSDPIRLPNRWPFGLDWIWGMLGADKEKTFMQFVDNRFAMMNYRTHIYTILSSTNYGTADAKNIQAMLATQFNDFALGQRRRGSFFPLMGNGIFTADGRMWEHSRSMMRPQFAREQVSDLELEEQHIQNLMRALPVREGGWTDEIDISVLFFRLTLDSACEFLFGESVESQIHCLPENLNSKSKSSTALDSNEFAIAFDAAQKVLSVRARFQNLYWLIGGPEFRRNCKIVHNYIDYFVNLALNKELKEKEAERGHGSLKKEKYIFLEALATQTRDPIELRSQLLNILLAGRDTTASLLGWTFYELVRRPEVYNKLREAIIADFGTYTDDRAALSETITFSRLKNCSYLQHVLNESLRVHPVVPLNFRQAVRDTTLPVGGGPDGKGKIFIPKGRIVEYSVHIMHQLPDLWGEDAAEFKPERWAGRKAGWEYLPFNGGPRICLGQQFALTEASYVIVRLLQRFDSIQNLEPEGIMKHNLTLTSSPGNGVKLRLREAPKEA